MAKIDDPLDPQQVVDFLKEKKERWEGFQKWWDEDWSWEGLKKRKISDSDSGFAASNHTVQKSWSDQYDRLVTFANRTWTRFHLPPCDREGNICLQYTDQKGDDFWERLKERLPQVRISRDQESRDYGKGIRLATLFGVVLPGWEMKKENDFVLAARFQSALFLGTCNFLGWRLRCEFVYAKFLGGDANFYQSIFSGGDTIFYQVEFSGGRAIFDEARFLGGVGKFSATRFSGGNAEFIRSHFSGGLAIFDRVQFSGGRALFSSTRFSFGANFRGAVFSGGGVSFENAVFSGSTFFTEAQYTGGETNYAGAQFRYDASFDGTKGMVFNGYTNFSGVRFGGDVNFQGRIFLNRTDFRNSRFCGVARFHDCDLHQETFFDGTKFEDVLGLNS